MSCYGRLECTPGCYFGRNEYFADRDRSEFFLPLLLHGRFVVERDTDDVLLRFQEHRPLKMSGLNDLPSCYSMLAYRRLLNTPIANILRAFPECRKNSWDIPGGCREDETNKGVLPEELKTVVDIVKRLEPKSPEHGLCVAFWVYVFNVHNQSDCPTKHLAILDAVALEMVTDHTKGPVNERQYTIWTIATIGATASLSPWRLDLPFMGHIIEWMEYQQDLENLTNMLRGYYLYGASKEVLRSGLDNWYKC